METIILNRDNQGNYLIGLTGLVYLIEHNYLLNGAPIIMVESDHQVSEYYLDTEDMGQSDSPCIVLADGEDEPSFLPFDGYAFEAKYLIMEQDVNLEGWHTANEVKSSYMHTIDYKEALNKLAKGLPVYYNEPSTDMIMEIDSDSKLSAEMILDGNWYEKENKGIFELDEEFDDDMELFDLEWEEEAEDLELLEKISKLKDFLQISQEELDDLKESVLGSELASDVASIEEIVDNMNENDVRTLIKGLALEGILEFPNLKKSDISSTQMFLQIDEDSFIDDDEEDWEYFSD